MLEQLDKRLMLLKQEITRDVAAIVVAEVQKLAAALQVGPPSALTRKEACARLSIGPTKLKAMIARREIATCRVGKVEMIPMVEIRRITEPAHPAPRRAGGAPKRKPYSATSEAERGREMLKKR